MIDREKFFHCLQNGGLPRRKVELPDGEHVFVRGMTLGESSEVSKYASESRAMWGAYIVCVCTVYEDGNPFFTMNDLESIAKMPRKYTAPIHTAAMEMSGLTDEEEPEGNEDTITADSSG